MPDLIAKIREGSETTAILANELEQLLKRLVVSHELTEFRAGQIRLIFRRHDKCWRELLTKDVSTEFLEMSKTADELLAEIEQLRVEARNR